MEEVILWDLNVPYLTLTRFKRPLSDVNVSRGDVNVSRDMILITLVGLLYNSVKGFANDVYRHKGLAFGSTFILR